MKYISSIFFILISITCFAADKIKIHHPWARVTTGDMLTSAAYMEIENISAKDLIVISAETDIAKHTEIHKTITDENGISKMIHIDKLLLPKNTTVILKPKSTHIMLMDLKHGLKQGDSFDLKLKFDDGESTIIKVFAKNPI